jgi:MinD superfamily P-loop ATPase
LLTIPFDRRIAEAYSRGTMIVEELPEWRQRFIELFHKIETIVHESKAAVCAK